MSAGFVPSLLGIPLKAISLVTLTVQNSALTILLHYSRVSVGPDEMYSAASAVFLNELLKMAVSVAVSLRNEVSALSPAAHHIPLSSPSLSEKRRSTETWSEGFDAKQVGKGMSKLISEVFSSDCWKLSIPACLYVVQNNLQFVAASNLDVATFQVTYNLKILTTALCSVIMLGRKLSAKKWMALFLLAAGVAMIQIQAVPDSAKDFDRPSMDRAKGLIAVVAACTTSGLAGVYFEKVLKGSKTDLWIRNVQLSLFSIVPAMMPIFMPGLTLFGLLPRQPAGPRQPILANFGFWAWAVVLTQTFGGLVTALVIKYSDNLLKGFATSLAIILSTVAGFFLFGDALSFTFLIGASTVILATWMYNKPDTQLSASSSANPYAPLPSMSQSSLHGRANTPPHHVNGTVKGVPPSATADIETSQSTPYRRSPPTPVPDRNGGPDFKLDIVPTNNR